MGFPGGANGKEPACQFRRQKRYGFNPWVGKIPWRREWQSTPVFLLWTEEPGGLQSMGLQSLGHNLATKQQTTHSKGRMQCVSEATVVLKYRCLVFRGWVAS